MKALWLNSGGPDSLLAGAMVQEWDTKPELISLFVDMNPEARDRMLNGARRNCELLGVEQRVIVPTPDVHDLWFTNSRGYRANPYLAFHVHLKGAQQALHREIDTVISGFKADASGYEWAVELQHLIAQTGPGNEKDRFPVLWFPLLDFPISMEWTVAEAVRRGLPLDHTWSCNRYPADLTCFKCLGRQRVGLRAIRNKTVLTGTSLSVKKEDDSTEAWSATVTTDPTADPITAIDPA